MQSRNQSLKLISTEKKFSGIMLSKPIVMGIINVTPDSFSDGGEVFDPTLAVQMGLQMCKDGADILDIGGASSRPGASPVDIKEEIRRIVPVVGNLAGCGAKLSVDTNSAAVMKAGIDAGAEIINDITALTGDPLSLDLAADVGVSVILMHMRGTPENMQENPYYEDAPSELRDYFLKRVKICERAGINRSKIAIDPGIGFGKSLLHNLQILNCLEIFQELGLPIVLGASRKSFIGKLSKSEKPKDCLPGSLASVVLARGKGVNIFRVHDVPETLQALKITDAIISADC